MNFHGNQGRPLNVTIMITMCGLTLMDVFVLLPMLKLSRKAVFGYVLFPQAFPQLLQSFDVRSINYGSSLTYSVIPNLNRILRVMLQLLTASCTLTVI